MQLITVYRAFNPAEAQLVRSRLEAAEFHPVVTHELSALSLDGYAMAAGGILVQVPDEEASDAKELIEAAQSGPPPEMEEPPQS
jgi:Putative prokaryotic signal transducing protein